MPLDPQLARALQPFAHRAASVTLVRAGLACVIAAALLAELAFLLGVRTGIGAAALAAATAGAAMIIARNQRLTPIALARRIDARARLNDLVVTSLTCNGDGMPAVVRRSAIDALTRESPRVIFPFEPPSRWRRWLAAAAAAQIIAIPLASRMPDVRPAQPGLTSLALPAAGSTSPPSANHEAGALPPASANQSSPKESTAANRPNVTADVATPAPADAATALASRPGDDDRLRIATANMNADIDAGRVPIARRAIVEKYFAAIHRQKERHR